MTIRELGSDGFSELSELVVEIKVFDGGVDRVLVRTRAWS